MVTRDHKHPLATRRKLHDGQLTIPDEFRQALGIEPDDEIELRIIDDELRLVRLNDGNDADRKQALRALYEQFAPVRAEIQALGISEDEVNADIEEAVRAVRRAGGESA